MKNLRSFHPVMVLLLGGLCFLGGIWLASAENEGVVSIPKEDATEGYWVITMNERLLRLNVGDAFLHNTGTGEVFVLDGETMTPVKMKEPKKKK